MKAPILTTTALLTTLAATSPTIAARQATPNCEQWGSIVTGEYTIYNNLWGASSANPGGKQCFSVTSLIGNSVTWSTTWTWTGAPNSVKSYPNAVYNPSKSSPRQISSISSLPTTWSWSYTIPSNSATKTVADVAYDLFTSSSPGGKEEFELMVWLAALGGAGPISAKYGADGKPVPIGSATLAGQTWDVYKGPNGQMTVFSFLPRQETRSFSGDLKVFYDYLVKQQGFPSSQYLISAGAGTEPFVGEGVTFTTSKYSFGIK